MSAIARCADEGRARPILRRLAYVSLALILLGVRATANSTSPPPLWISGWYDGDNFDDATEAFFHVKGIPAELALSPACPASLSPPDLLPPACLAPLASVLPPGPVFRLPRPRAPPLS